MNRFGLLFKHYLKRQFLYPANLGAMLLLPTAIILLFAYINDSAIAGEGLSAMFYGHNVVHTSLVIGNVFFFQLFGSFTSMESLHELYSTEHKSRLFVAPIDRKWYPIAIMAASWVVLLVQGLIVIGVTSAVLNVYWGNMIVNIFTLLGLSLVAQGLGLIFFGISKSAGVGNAIAYPVTFFIGGLSGMVLPIAQIFDNQIINFIADWSPLTLAIHAVPNGGRFGTVDLLEGTYTGGDMSIAIRNILIIFAFAAVLAAVGFVLGKVKKAW